MKDILDQMRIQKINGAPMSLAEQRRMVKSMGFGRTPADDAAEAAAAAKRARKAEKLARDFPAIQPEGASPP